MGSTLSKNRYRREVRMIIDSNLGFFHMLGERIASSQKEEDLVLQEIQQIDIYLTSQKGDDKHLAFVLGEIKQIWVRMDMLESVRIKKALRKLSPRLMVYLDKDIHTQNKVNCIKAITLTIGDGFELFATKLLSLLKSEDKLVRTQAAYSFEPLSHFMEHRREIEKALAKLLLNDASESVKKACAFSLGSWIPFQVKGKETRSPGRAALREARYDRSIEVRELARRAIESRKVKSLAVF